MTSLGPHSAALKTVLDCLPQAVIITNRDGATTLFNRAAQGILGDRVAAAKPTDWARAYDLCLPDGTTPCPDDRLPLVRALRGEVVINEQLIMKKGPQGASHRISMTAHPLYESNEEVTGVVVVIRDVTQRADRGAYDDPQAVPFATLVKRMRSGILVEDENRRILFANQPFRDLFEIAGEPVVRVGMDTTVAAERLGTLFRDPERFGRRVDGLIEDRTTVFGETLELNDGRVIERDYIPVFDNGDFRGHIWKYRDVSERVESHRTMKVFERLCRAVEQTADSVVITDRDGRIEYVNPGFEATTGYARDEVLGRSPGILKSGRHEPAFYRKLWDRILSGQTFEGTIINRKKTGELYSSQQTITPIRDDEGNISHFVSVLKDMTETLKRQELEIEMRLAREVQQRLYGHAADVPGYDVAGTALPIGATGGDYFDFIPMPDGSMGVVIADVCSHGMAAALVMAQIRAYLRSFALHSNDPGTIVTQLNRALAPDLQDGHFVTLLLACLDPKARSLAYASAGHLPAFLLRASGETDLALEATGPPIGLEADLEYESSNRLPFTPGQSLLLITDGVTDSLALEDIELGMTRAVAFVKARRQEPARATVEALCHRARDSAVRQHQQDDITSVVIKAI